VRQSPKKPGAPLKIRNSKKAPYHAAFVLDFEHLDFGFVSDFEIRISCFKENDVALSGAPGAIEKLKCLAYNSQVFRK
jgi:hypothetical protein